MGWEILRCLRDSDLARRLRIQLWRVSRCDSDGSAVNIINSGADSKRWVAAAGVQNL